MNVYAVYVYVIINLPAISTAGVPLTNTIRTSTGQAEKTNCTITNTAASTGNEIDCFIIIIAI